MRIYSRGVVRNERPFLLKLAAANKLLVMIELAHAYITYWRDILVSEAELDDICDVVNEACKHLHDVNFSGQTLLHWSARLNKIGPLQKFLDDPACAIDAKCSQGKTALDCAIAAGAKESIEFLRNHPKQQAIDAEKAKAEENARLDAEKAKAEAEAKAKAKADERASLVAEVKAELLAQIAAEKTRADAKEKARLKEEAVAKARIEAEARAKSQAEAAAKAKAEEKTRLAAEKAKAEAEAKTKAEENARLAAEKAKAEAAEQAKADLVAHARQAIPNDFQCPITTQVMYEPMMAADGESYEKEYIEAWLVTRNTSPLTNELLTHKHLTPNKNLKRAIDELLDKYPVLKETGDYYLANSLIQQALNAVERCDAKELERLVNIHFGLVRENLHKVIALPKPKVDSQSSTSSCSEPIEPEVTAIQPEPAPLYLLNLICEKGDVACLNVAIKRMGADLKNTVLKQNHNNPDGLLQLLAKRQESAGIDILTAALGYKSGDYLRLMSNPLNVDGIRGLWLDYYLKAHQESPEIVLENMITTIPAQEAVATLKNDFDSSCFFRVVFTGSSLHQSRIAR